MLILHINDFANGTKFSYVPRLKNTQASGVQLMVSPPGFAPMLRKAITVAPGMHTTLHINPVKKEK